MSKKFKLKISQRLMKKRVRKKVFAAKACRFKNNPDLAQEIDYKNTQLLRGFITERGKILPSRVSGNSYYYQRRIAQEIKLARQMALLPFCPIES